MLRLGLLNCIKDVEEKALGKFHFSSHVSYCSFFTCHLLSMLLRRKGQKDENELQNLEILAQENLLLDTIIILKASVVPESLIRISALNLSMLCIDS